MDFLIFLYLILFPFGKLLGILPDIIILVICALSFLSLNFRTKKSAWINFIAVCVFSLFFSLIFFNPPQILTGALYLVRFVSYIIFSKIIWDKYGKSKDKKELMIQSLIAIGFFVAVFGWIQYLVFPDLTALKIFGWDDHYFRLVSTLLDPAFTGIILVLTEILVVLKTVKKQTKLLFFLNVFLVMTIAFTYSRASYLSLVLSLIILVWKFRQKLLFFILVFFVLLIPILPKPAGEGVNLARTYSINEKFKNYRDSAKLFEQSPIFGVGFNNICEAKQKFLNNGNPVPDAMHSCSGLDNSLFFILATTGIAGVFVFVDAIYMTLKNTSADYFGLALKLSFFAIFIHGMYTNTFFYSFVLGWVAILVAISRRAESDF